MKIALQSIKVSELIAGFEDKAEEGVRGYSGRLNIRPPYQREFIYDDKKRNEVIQTVRKNFPLNTMYWVKAGDDHFELMDGQQRTISICRYVAGDFSIEIDGSPMNFGNLTGNKQQEILDYDLQVYVCEGTDDEKLAWFKIINIAGEKLTDQELANAIYTGTWLTDAKRWFSKRGAPAAAIGDKLVTGAPIRQEYLETALDWLSNGAIEHYMAEHQDDQNANELWTYFQAVINWVNVTFPKYRKEMKGVAWGRLYNKYGKELLDTSKLESDVSRLMQDEDVTKKPGIYDYVLTGNERLSLDQSFHRQYETRSLRAAGRHLPCLQQALSGVGEMEADHITPWSKGGRTIANNCQMLCKPDNRIKSGK